jgi:hypothetical protein
VVGADKLWEINSHRYQTVNFDRKTAAGEKGSQSVALRPQEMLVAEKKLERARNTTNWRVGRTIRQPAQN